MPKLNRDTVTVVVAAVVAIAYCIGLIIMWRNVGDLEVGWGRRFLLFTGLEAIVFAAVGWLFGKEINRGAAKLLSESTNRMVAEVYQRGLAEGRGQALAEAIRAATSADNAQVESRESLRRLADRLFPERRNQ